MKPIFNEDPLYFTLINLIMEGLLKNIRYDQVILCEADSKKTNLTKINVHGVECTIKKGPSWIEKSIAYDSEKINDYFKSTNDLKLHIREKSESYLLRIRSLDGMMYQSGFAKDIWINQ